MIRIIYKYPGQPPKTLLIQEKPLTIKGLLGGNPKAVSVGKGLVMFINEMGKTLKMRQNIIYGFHRIVGPIIFANVQEGRLDSLTEEQMKEARDIIGGGDE